MCQGTSALSNSAPTPAQYELENDPAAKVREAENDESTKVEVHGAPAAPAGHVSADEQYTEDEQSEQRQDCLVDEVLGEQVLDERDAEHHGHGQHDDAGGRDAVQHAFGGFEGREQLVRGRQFCGSQSFVLDQGVDSDDGACGKQSHSTRVDIKYDWVDEAADGDLAVPFEMDLEYGRAIPLPWERLIPDAPPPAPPPPPPGPAPETPVEISSGCALSGAPSARGFVLWLGLLVVLLAARRARGAGDH